ncbi:MAG: SDR family NAD(P)-dependent oxidoreductase [Candidatus Thorarchaeota archaeon]|jgi:3-oxoacyl-[acyl-carrier protein] reductase
MKSKVCLVTGGTQGIGLAVSRHLVKENVVYSISRQHADVRCNASIKRLVEEIIEKHGRIDVLVNSAGIYYRGTVEEMCPLTWKSIIDTNLNGTFNCCHYVIPHMKEQSYGRIVNLTSYVVDYLPEERGAYCCSKIGVNALTTILAKEVADYDIKVNCFSPLKTSTLMDIDGTAIRKPEDAVPYIVDLCNLPEDGPSGHYYVEGEDRT